MATEGTSKAQPSPFDPAELAKLGQKQAAALTDVQKELYTLVEQANRDWITRTETERELAAQFTARLSAARSLPDAAQIYQEWMTKRMEMLAEDSRKFFADSQKLIQSSARLLLNGWQGNRS
jgi:hypothetical protein